MVTISPRTVQKLFIASSVMLIISLALSGLNVASVLSAPLLTTVSVPNEVGFEGYLTDGEGDPLPDGAYDLTFRVYAAGVGGTALYTETQTITTTSGLYSALIGSVTTLPAGLFDGERWIGVTVDEDDELTPRVRVASVPFALNAENANTADSAESADAVAWSGVTGKPAGFSDDIDNDSGGDITGVTAGTGLSGGGTTGSVTVSADTAYLQRRVSTSCPAGSYIRSIAADGIPTCSSLSGMIALFDANCPTGWTEVLSTRGRVVVGNPTNPATNPNDIGDTQGTAFNSTQQQRTITTVPAHTHSVNITTSSNGTHSHGSPTQYGYWSGQSGGTYGFASGSTYYTNDSPNTASAGAHTHTVSGNTASTGSASVDVTMPYIQLVYCKLN